MLGSGSLGVLLLSGDLVIDSMSVVFSNARGYQGGSYILIVYLVLRRQGDSCCLKHFSRENKISKVVLYRMDLILSIVT